MLCSHRAARRHCQKTGASISPSFGGLNESFTTDLRGYSRSPIRPGDFTTVKQIILKAIGAIANAGSNRQATDSGAATASRRHRSTERPHAVAGWRTGWARDLQKGDKTSAGTSGPDFAGPSCGHQQRHAQSESACTGGQTGGGGQRRSSYSKRDNFGAGGPRSQGRTICRWTVVKTRWTSWAKCLGGPASNKPRPSAVRSVNRKQCTVPTPRCFPPQMGLASLGRRG